MEELEKPRKRKDQIRHDKEVAQRLQAQMQAELDEEDSLVRQKEEANIISWDNMQKMIDTDYQMAQQMQAKKKQEYVGVLEEKSELFCTILEFRPNAVRNVRNQVVQNAVQNLDKVLKLSRSGSLCQQLQSKVKETGCCLSSVGIKRLHDDPEVTAAKVCVTTASTKLMKNMLSINAAGV
ncbi:hypothetical protein Tco_0184048 [Tanacetum coccineum]